ncbi:uncharacterized protein LOC129907931 [Episyrphus balteatus]|uniref:uncharacterized protein LOC129907931 n=1 Tax=Episyrphus balteatus TaxID=286459 RepID=UPI002485AC4A|nr:uncharacterized protein LOC129907931 [Episyrphus balteatus]
MACGNANCSGHPSNTPLFQLDNSTSTSSNEIPDDPLCSDSTKSKLPNSLPTGSKKSKKRGRDPTSSTNNVSPEPKRSNLRSNQAKINSEPQSHSINNVSLSTDSANSNDIIPISLDTTAPKPLEPAPDSQTSIPTSNTSNNNRFSLYYQNVRGLRSKTTQSYNNSQAFPYDLLAFTETWLNATILDTELFDKEFLVYRKDRHVDVKSPVGGGVLIAVRNNFCSSLVTFPFKLNIELICIKILVKSRHLFVLNVYIPPKTSPSTFAELSIALDFVFGIADLDSSILLLGDFNLLNIDWVPSEDESYLEASSTSSQQELHLLDNIISTDLQQVSCIKNFRNRILDLVFSSDAVNTVVTEASTAISNIDIYHPPLEIFLDLGDHLLENSNPQDTSFAFDFRKANYQQLSDILNTSGIENLPTSDDIEITVSHFYRVLNNCISEIVPQKRSKYSKVSHPLYTKELKILRNKRNKAWKNYVRTLCPSNKEIYISLFEEFKTLSNNLYADYLSSMESSLKLDPKYFWKFVNMKKKSDGYPVNFSYENNMLKNTSDICDAFATNFCQSFIDILANVDVDYFRYLENCPQVTFNNIQIDTCKVSHFLSLLHEDYSVGPDGIPAAVLKNFR